MVSGQMPATVLLPAGQSGLTFDVPLRDEAFLQVDAYFEVTLLGASLVAGECPNLANKGILNFVDGLTSCVFVLSSGLCFYSFVKGPCFDLMLKKYHSILFDKCFCLPFP